MKPLDEILKMESPSKYLYRYACKHGRLEFRWEELLLRFEDFYWIYSYARDVIKDRWPEAEEYIVMNPEWAYEYARYVIKERWKEAEKYIMKDPGYAYCYAGSVIEGRWKEAEKYIKKDPEWAYLYARHIIRGRWLEAEEYMEKNNEVLLKYLNFLNGIDQLPEIKISKSHV